MRGFVGRMFAPLVGLGRAIVSFGLGPVTLPSGQVKVVVEDVDLVRVDVADVQPPVLFPPLSG